MGGVIRHKVARVLSGALLGYDGKVIEVETDIKAGLPGVQIVGMGNKAIDEARQRVRSAITNSLLTFPAQKLTINLAPAELPKDGTHFDLPIALSILVASGQLRQHEVNETLFAGELGLDGTLRPVKGGVLLAELAHLAGYKRIVLPAHNAPQAGLVPNIDVIGVTTLHELYRRLKGVVPTTVASNTPSATVTAPITSPIAAHTASPVATSKTPILDSIVGHERAKRALAIAAAGRHNVLLSGSPGAGKTMLAKAFTELLPPLSPEEIIEVTKLHSLASGDDGAVQTAPPFRAPHHSITLTALIGGGLRPKPGELSLAHKGVLLLDELPEYPRVVLEALRQPLEDRAINLVRLYGRITYPADISVIATMNPCPCGYAGDATTACSCSALQIQAYQKRVSGPLMDRFDLRITVDKVNYEQLFSPDTLHKNQHSLMLSSISLARKAQAARYGRSYFYNANASLEQARQLFHLTPAATTFLNTSSQKMGLTSRGYTRVIRIARTIADMEHSKNVDVPHIAEALQYR